MHSCKCLNGVVVLWEYFVFLLHYGFWYCVVALWECDVLLKISCFISPWFCVFCLEWDVNVIMGREEKSRVNEHKLGLHNWGPWSMGSIVCHFHSYSTLGVIREKWWRKEVNEVWVWRKLKLLVVCGGGCLWSPKRAWKLFMADMIWYGKPPCEQTFTLCSRFHWWTFVKYLGKGLLSVVNVMFMHL